MKLPYKIYLFVIFIVCIADSLSAQQVSLKITGSVVDSITLKPLNYVTIHLKVNNVKVRSSLSNSGGEFVFDNVMSAKYTLTFVSIGYTTKTVGISDTTKSVNMGSIYLSTEIKNLKEVQITADRPIIKQQAERITYDLQADPESKSNNVLTMMRKVPFLSLDGNNNLLLKGNSSYRVLINGKPSGMLENNLKAVLQSMPASTIQSIEVITNPPAKYDAEGLAGIINIITNKKVDNGFKGSLNVNENFPNGGPGAGISFSAKRGKFGATGYGGGNLNKSPTTEFTNNRVTFGNNATNLLQAGSNKSSGRSGYFGTELSYDIDSLNLISTQFNINGNHGDGENGQNTLLNNNAGILQSYSLNNTNNNSGNGLDAGINYQMGFKRDKTKLLTLAYRYYNYQNNQFSDIGITNQVNYLSPNYRQNNNTRNSEQTYQVDYVQQIKKLSVESGVKAILRNNKSDFDYLSLNSSTGQFDLDADFSDSFNYNQDVFGAYNSYRYNSKSWSFSGGLRIEKTLIDANFVGSQTTLDKGYFNVMPNLAVNKEFKDKSSMSFGFNQRIKRPNIRRLNPFVDRSNPSFETTGNPNLRPVVNNNLQLSFNSNKKLSITASASYGFINNMDLRISTVDPVTNITRTTYQNTGKAARLGLDYNLGYKINNQWNVSLNGNVENFNVSGQVGETLVHINKTAAYLLAATGYKFNSGWRLNANVMLRSRAITDLQSSTNAFVSTSLAVNKDVIKNKLSFSASVNNPFTKLRYNVTDSFGPDFTQVLRNQEYFRSFNLSLNYNFGQLKGNVKKSNRGINNDDVSK